MVKSNIMERSKNKGDYPGKPGPKGLFHPNMLHQVFELARFGYTNSEIADFYGMSVKTVELWCRNKGEFADALYRGRIEHGLKTVSSLAQRATGYEFQEVSEEFVFHKNEVGEVKKVLKSRKITRKHMAADITAAIYLLKTRYPQWAEIHKTELNVSGNIHMVQQWADELGNFKTEELLALEKLGIQNMLVNGNSKN